MSLLSSFFLSDYYSLFAIVLFLGVGIFLYVISVKNKKKQRNENIKKRIGVVDERIVGNKKLENAFEKNK